jgi:erythromycin esterase
MNVEKDIYFVDLENAFNNDQTILVKKSKHLVIGGGGYQPKPLYKIMSSIYMKLMMV